jgi:hypothetical protein
MAKTIKNSAPLYLAVQDEDTFKLVSAEIQENDTGSIWIKRTPLTLIETYEMFQAITSTARRVSFLPVIPRPDRSRTKAKTNSFKDFRPPYQKY